MCFANVMRMMQRTSPLANAKKPSARIPSRKPYPLFVSMSFYASGRDLEIGLLTFSSFLGFDGRNEIQWNDEYYKILDNRD